MKLYWYALKYIEKTDQKKILQIQSNLTKVLFHMENQGVKVDTDYVKKATTRISHRKEEIEQKIKKITDGAFD